MRSRPVAGTTLIDKDAGKVDFAVRQLVSLAVGHEVLRHNRLASRRGASGAREGGSGVAPYLSSGGAYSDNWQTACRARRSTSRAKVARAQVRLESHRARSDHHDLIVAHFSSWHTAADQAPLSVRSVSRMRRPSLPQVARSRSGRASAEATQIGDAPVRSRCCCWASAATTPFMQVLQRPARRGREGAACRWGCGGA